MLVWIIGALGLGALGLLGAWVYMTAFVEEPPFRQVMRDGDFSVRDYPALAVAEVARRGARRQALSAGFSPLAGYIFARERQGEKIAMTAPVAQQQDGDAWTVRFYMPPGRTLASLPKPGAGEDVSLHEEPPARRAVARFSGRADDAMLAEQTARLEAWMAENGLRASGAPPIYAYYNDPFTPGFLRRNEVMIDLQAP